MRLYAFLLVAVVALHARAATIPASETEKKLIDVVPDNLDKVPANSSSEQELLDQTNTIKDVENKLRVKPGDIPVEVIVENPQTSLKTDDEKKESEEINRPAPDLRNPGPPQRQEHETQNPEYYATEQQTVMSFKQSIIDAQNVLRQGFQGVVEGIQNMISTNEPIQTLEQRIQSLRDSFTAQMNRLDGTIQTYLNTESSNIEQPAVQQTKASFHQIQKGLSTLRNDFNTGVKNLAEGVGFVSSLKAENENPSENNPGSASTAAPASPAPAVPPFFQMLQNLQQTLSNSMQNLTNTMTQLSENQGWNIFNQASSSPATPAGAQSDEAAPSSTPSSPFGNIWQGFQTQISNLFSPQAGQFGSGSGPINTLQNNFNQFISNFQPKPASQPPAQPAPTTQAATSQQTTSKPAETEPAKPASSAEASGQTSSDTQVGPIRQILQNNPITKGIAGVVQKLQNVNNPEKPRDVVPAEEQKNKDEKIDEKQPDSESKKGGGPNTGDNNNSGDRVEQNEAIKEDIQKVPEVQKPTEEEIKEHKTEEIVNKTE